MSTKSYKFEWIGPLQWRLTSRVGMVWEGEVCAADESTLKDTNGVSLMATKLTKGMNTTIPVNGLEKISYYIKRMVVKAVNELERNIIYGR